MTKDELRIEVFERALHWGNTEKWLQVALEQNGGDVERALQWLIDNTDHPPILGGSGAKDAVCWEHFGGWRGTGTAHFPEHWEGSKYGPDLTFTYKDLLRYLAAGKPKNIQLELF